jgi:hypothetical protein
VFDADETRWTSSAGQETLSARRGAFEFVALADEAEDWHADALQ